MKISIITPSFNQGAYIERNIKSVLQQNSRDFEHIVIDGGSTDTTKSILKSYPHLIWVSEDDEGQADALNKGLALCKGDIVGWINSDDYYESNILANVLDQFKDKNVKWIVGNVAFVYPDLANQKIERSPKITYENLIQNPDIVRQQGVFFRRSVLEEAGGWDAKKYMVMDFDLWVRLAKKYQPKMVDCHYANFTWHSDQKSSPRNTIRQIKEIDEVFHQGVRLD